MLASASQLVPSPQACLYCCTWSSQQHAALRATGDIKGAIRGYESALHVMENSSMTDQFHLFEALFTLGDLNMSLQPPDKRAAIRYYRQVMLQALLAHKRLRSHTPTNQSVGVAKRMEEEFADRRKRRQLVGIKVAIALDREAQLLHDE